MKTINSIRRAISQEENRGFSQEIITQCRRNAIYSQYFAHKNSDIRTNGYKTHTHTPNWLLCDVVAMYVAMTDPNQYNVKM